MKTIETFFTSLNGMGGIEFVICVGLFVSVCLIVSHVVGEKFEKH